MLGYHPTGARKFGGDGWTVRRARLVPGTYKLLLRLVAAVANGAWVKAEAASGEAEDDCATVPNSPNAVTPSD